MNIEHVTDCEMQMEGDDSVQADTVAECDTEAVGVRVSVPFRDPVRDPDRLGMVRVGVNEMVSSSEEVAVGVPLPGERLSLTVTALEVDGDAVADWDCEPKERLGVNEGELTVTEQGVGLRV